MPNTSRKNQSAGNDFLNQRNAVSSGVSPTGCSTVHVNYSMILRFPFFTVSRKFLPRVAVFAALASTSVAVAQAQTAGAPLAVTTFAGQAGTRQVTNGTGTAARFYAPSGMVFLPNGDLIVADTANNVFRRVTPAGVVTYYAGRPIDQEDRPINAGSADGTFANATFFIGYATAEGQYTPPISLNVGSVSMAVDGAGNITFADTLNNTIRRLGANGVVSTVAGQPHAQGTQDGSGSNARFFVPSGVAIDSGGNVYVADTGNHTIRKITPSGIVSTLAGVGGQSGSANGTGTSARFKSPSGIVSDSGGNLYVTDTGSHTIRKVTPGGAVTTLAGVANAAGSSDGSGSLARFNSPTGIAIDSGGNLFVTEVGTQTIRRVSAAGAVTTIAGATGQRGSADGTGNTARFEEPMGIAVDSGGTVYIADTLNNTIRRGLPVTGSGAPTLTVQSQPQRQQVIVGSPATFRVVASGTPSPSYQWQRNGVNIAGANSATYTINAAQYVDNGALFSALITSGTITFSSAPALLQVFPSGTAIPPIVILAQPTDREVIAGQPVTFAVEITGTSAPTFQWRRNGVIIPGALSASYTLSSVQSGDAGVYTVTITDGANTASTAGATLTVLPASVSTPPSITTQPESQSAPAGATVTFSAVATSTPAPIFQWRKDGTPLGNGGSGTGASVSGATTATLTLTGISDSDAGNYTLSVSNSAGSTTSSAAALTIVAAPPSSRIINLSILTPLNTSGKDFTMGYVVGGNNTTGAKPLVIRAAGPSLGALGVPGTLADPKLELFASTTKTGENDNWGGSTTLVSAMASVGAFAYTSATSLDAASAVSVSTRDNSVKVSSANQGTGLVIAEVYDATPEAAVSATTPRLVNVSVLKSIGTGLTAGFVIRGATNKTVLIRAIGPTLGGFGVGNVISDPQLTLFRGQSAIGTNNNWGGTAELTTAFTNVGAFGLPPASLDAALLATLQPGDYTVQVTGVGSATGVGLVEVYEVP